MNVWLFERHTLPVVAVTVAMPSGSASDPKDHAGLAHITADMLDEGAGKRNAVELSTAINDLGATLGTGATADGSFVVALGAEEELHAGVRDPRATSSRARASRRRSASASPILWKGDLKKRADDPIVGRARRLARGLVRRRHRVRAPVGRPARDGVEGRPRRGQGLLREELAARIARRWSSPVTSRGTSS